MFWIFFLMTSSTVPRPIDDDENWLDDIFMIYIQWPLFMQNLKSIGAVWKFLFFWFFLILMTSSSVPPYRWWWELIGWYFRDLHTLVFIRAKFEVNWCILKISEFFEGWGILMTSSWRPFWFFPSKELVILLASHSLPVHKLWLWTPNLTRFFRIFDILDVANP